MPSHLRPVQAWIRNRLLSFGFQGRGGVGLQARSASLVRTTAD